MRSETNQPSDSGGDAVPEGERAQRFARAFAAVYLRFHRRVPLDAYRPSREALAVLRHLRGSGPLTLGEAALHFERSQAAMSEIVTRLERRGLLARVADQRDRRRSLVWLSPDGLGVLEREEQVLSVDLLRHAFDQLEAQEAEGLLERLTAFLNTDPSPSADPPDRASPSPDPGDDEP